MRVLIISLLSLLALASSAPASGSFPLTDASSALIGSTISHTITNEETLILLARAYGVGYNEITDANSSVDPWVPREGTVVTIPTAWLLPEILDRGILINRAEMRLYYFFTSEGRHYVSTYPIGIGREGFDTPVGSYRITLKVKDPIWRVPEGIREEDPELPAFVHPGPDNPLGKYWLQLSLNGYGIHGTNKPYGIGRRVSHGCIRLYPEDIDILARIVKPGTPVKIINEPVKVGTHEETVYLEVHRSDRTEDEVIASTLAKLRGKHLLKFIDSQRMIETIKTATGLPAQISR